MSENRKIRVAVLAGGPSNEREVSLKSAEQVFKSLSTEKYQPSLIEITVGREWVNTQTQERVDPLSLRDDFDIAFIAMHGVFAEDGRIQSILEWANLPYTGSGVLASSLGMDKVRSRVLANTYGIAHAEFFTILKGETNETIHTKIEQSFGYPCVVKPSESGSSIGVSIVKNADELLGAIDQAQKEPGAVIIEKYIRGIEVTCGVIGNPGEIEITALPVVEIVPKSQFFDYKAKYEAGGSDEICPARLSPEITEKIQSAAKKVHQILGCAGLTRSDFILTAENDLFFLEINTIPGLTEASLCPKEAKAAGIQFPEFIDMQIEMALRK